MGNSRGDRVSPHKEQIEGWMSEGVSNTEMSIRLGIPRTTIRDAIARWQNPYAPRIIEEKEPNPSSAWAPPKQKTETVKFSDKKTFIITSVLNDCTFFANALKSMETFCREEKAQILAIPVRYKNVSLYQSPQQVHWPEEFNDYYLTEDLELCANLVVMGSMRIQATAARPLSGTVGCSKARSGVFGHPRLALETIATPGDQLPTIQFTTGTISHPSYSDTKAGRLGEFHHTMGAAIIEIEGDLFWWRHVHFDPQDGSFIDFGTRYTAIGPEIAPQAEALVLGDIHVDFHDKKVIDTILRDLSLEVRPKNIVLHDILDFFSASHHHERNPVLKAMKAHRNRDDVHAELSRVSAWLNTHVRASGSIFHIIDSNHHGHLDRWLDNVSDKVDAKNLLLWHQLNAERIEWALDQRDENTWDAPSAFRLAMENLLGDDFSFSQLRFHGSNTPLLFHGIDCGNHGDRGPNGARGSAQVFANTQRKTIIGHSHQPKIRDGCFQVGKSCIDRLPYMHGYSSHLSCSAIINSDGSRTLFPIIDGRYRRDVIRADSTAG